MIFGIRDNVQKLKKCRITYQSSPGFVVDTQEGIRISSRTAKGQMSNHKTHPDNPEAPPSFLTACSTGEVNSYEG